MTKKKITKKNILSIYNMFLNPNVRFENLTDNDAKILEAIKKLDEDDIAEERLDRTKKDFVNQVYEDLI